MDKKRIFISRWGFILSAVCSAVGMANVWGWAPTAVLLFWWLI